MIDPVTNQELHEAWRPMDTFPKKPGAREPSFVCVVLLGVRIYDKPPSAYTDRVQVGRFNENVSVIGGAFAFDQPAPVAWQPAPSIFKEETNVIQET